LSFASQFERALRALGTYEPLLFPASSVPADYRRAAVLIPFWAEGDAVRVVVTRRSSRLAAHGGQVAFPGGRLDPGESWEQAALREAHEEIGLDPSLVEVLGRLDDAWSGAGHHVVPIVGWVSQPPELVENPREVAEILVADVESLLLPESLSEDAFEHEGHRYVNPVLRWEGGDAYGLTAGLLLEALSWGQGAPAPGGTNRLNDLDNYRRRQADPEFPHGNHPVASGTRHQTRGSQ
jgi:8-oxo-dGTP pyrophosphatase MutT (NUDIX family)